MCRAEGHAGDRVKEEHDPNHVDGSIFRFRCAGVMRSFSASLVSPSPHGALLSAYNLWSSADFVACQAEVARVAGLSLSISERVEATLLSARAYLRCEQPQLALTALQQAPDLA